MPGAHITHEENVVGALSLVLGDRLRAATEEAAGLAGALPAALVSLHEWAGGRPIDVLANALRVSHSRAVRVVDRLEAEGLVKRSIAPQDRRKVNLRLTRKGARIFEQLAAVHRHELQRIGPQLSEFLEYFSQQPRQPAPPHR